MFMGCSILLMMFGPVDTYSAFPYENNIKSLRRYCRKPDLPLQQISNRLAERVQKTFRTKSSVTIALNKHNDGPLPPGIGDIEGQDRHFKTPNFSLTTIMHDSCCVLKNSSVCIIANIIVRQWKHYLVVKQFDTVESFYDNYIFSSSVGVFKCSFLQPELTLVSFDDILSKCYLLPLWESRRLNDNGNEEIIKGAFVAVRISCEIHYSSRGK